MVFPAATRPFRMSRRKADPAFQALRKYAAQGDMQSARNVLIDILRKTPNHALARAELERLDSGQPLQTLANLHRKEQARDVQNQERLTDALQAFRQDPQLFAGWKRARLKRARKEIIRKEKLAGHLLDAEGQRTFRQYCQALDRELARRAKPLRRRVVAGGIAAGAAALLVLTWVLLGRHAEQSADRLQASLRTGDTPELAACLKAVDTGFNRFFCKRMDFLVNAARTRIRREEATMKELAGLMQRIGAGKLSVAEMGPIRRMEIEQSLDALPKSADMLRKDWAKFCEAEKQQLAAQRMQLMRKLAEPLPPMVEPGNDLKEDEQKLESLRSELMERCLIFADSHSTGMEDEALVEPAQRALKKVNAMLRENRRLQESLARLAAAQDYGSYRHQLALVSPKYYTALAAAKETAATLPDHGTMLRELISSGKNIPHNLLAAARKTLVQGESAISPEFPATTAETHAADDLLGCTALSTPLFAISNEKGDTFFSEAAPEVKDGRVHFLRSNLDPGKPTGSDAATTWPDPHWVSSRRIDPSPLAACLHTQDRTEFYAGLNYGKALAAVIRCQAPECPALARAYVYGKLLDMVKGSGQRMLTGLPYSPSLQADMREFDQLRKRCGVELDGNCWLHADPAHERAEKAFAEWFGKHTRADYSGEMAENFTGFMDISPRFCGFVQPDGSPCYSLRPQGRQMVWFLTAEGLSTARHGEEMQGAIPFSPLFTAEKKK